MWGLLIVVGHCNVKGRVKGAFVKLTIYCRFVTHSTCRPMTGQLQQNILKKKIFAWSMVTSTVARFACVAGKKNGWKSGMWQKLEIGCNGLLDLTAFWEKRSKMYPYRRFYVVVI